MRKAHHFRFRVRGLATNNRKARESCGRGGGEKDGGPSLQWLDLCRVGVGKDGGP